MIGARLQGGIAVTLAVGVHLAGFSLGPDKGGAVSAGVGGDALVSLQAADAVIADLVEDWDSPPEVETAPLADLKNPETFDAPPSLEAPPEIVPPTVPMMRAPQLSDALPAISPPPAPPKPVAKPQPKPTPKAEAAPKPAAKKKASGGQAAQKAAGSGGGAQAGDAGKAGSATLSKARINDLRAGWGAAIRNRIERRKSYPSGARGASGTVTVRLSVNRSGALTGVAVAKSSGNQALDAAAVQAVKAAGRFPAAPNGLSDPSYSFTLPMRFSR